jgi:protease-4
MASENWQQESLDSFLMATLKEQRAKRRWGIFFKLIVTAYFLALLVMFIPSGSGAIVHAEPHTALIRIQDEISAQSLASAELIIPSLTAAFENPQAKAIILELNSPGGSPVQAGELYDEILRLRIKYPDKPVYAVITDGCASGCYYIAVAADEIYANEASLVGSIGVLFNGFGFVDLQQKLGIQRRLITAGKNKGFLDPFSTLSPEQEAYMHSMLAVVHNQFIDKVKARRSSKLADNDELFSGLIWTGEQAIPLGLVDKLGSVRLVAREVIGQPDLIDYTQQESFLTALANRMGVSFDRSMKSLVSTRLTLE